MDMNKTTERLIRMRELKTIIGYSATSIWRRCKEGSFHMGFDWKCDFDSPNVRFNISGKSPAITALDRTTIM